MNNKRVKKFLGILLVLMFAISSTAFAADSTSKSIVNISVDKKLSCSIPFSGFVDSSINDEGMLQKLKTSDKEKFKNDNLELDIIYPSKELKHDEEIDVSADISWINEQKSIKANLEGSALVYSQNNNTILLGSLFGYNGEETPENYITVAFTLDIKEKTGIATLSIGTDDGKDNRPITVEFGTNSNKYKDAILFLGNKIKSEGSVTSDSTSLNLDETSNVISLASVDTGIYERQTVVSNYGYGNFEAFSFFSHKQMLEGSSIEAIGKCGCNTANAAKYIVAQIQPTAINVSPRKIEGVVRARSNGFYCSTGENLPKNSQTSFTISIPLPLSQSYSLAITLASTTCSFITNTSYTVGTYHTTKWNFYDVSGINELEATSSELASFGTVHKGVAFSNRFFYGIDVPTGSVTKYIDGYGTVSFFYMYYDNTGNLNNAYWTSSCTVADQPVSLIGI